MDKRIYLYSRGYQEGYPGLPGGLPRAPRRATQGYQEGYVTKVYTVYLLHTRARGGPGEAPKHPWLSSFIEL